MNHLRRSVTGSEFFQENGVWSKYQKEAFIFLKHFLGYVSVSRKEVKKGNPYNKDYSYTTCSMAIRGHYSPRHKPIVEL